MALQEGVAKIPGVFRIFSNFFRLFLCSQRCTRGSGNAMTTTTTTTTTEDYHDKRQRLAGNLEEGNLPLIEKYRPKNLDDVVAQGEIVSTLTRLMESNQLPHLLFYGPAGVGKTSTILAIARKLYGTTNLASMVLELNASDARGIDDIRDEVVTFASTRKIFSSGMKLIILDEADNMTHDAQFALRRVIEKYTANARFCLICNYVSKIIPALQSRCTKFRFSPLAPEQITARVEDIARSEHIRTTKDGIDALLRLAHGDMRKVLNLLEASAMQLSDGVVDAGIVYTVAGKPTPASIDQILQSLLNDDVVHCVRVLKATQLEHGLALTDIVYELHERVRALCLPAAVTIYLLSELADVEHRLSAATDEAIQLAGLVSIFQLARHLVKQQMDEQKSAA